MCVELGPICLNELIKEARSIVDHESMRSLDLFSWAPSEVDAKFNEFTRLPKAFVDGEVVVYKSNSGEVLVNASSSFAMAHISPQLHPIADITVVILSDNAKGSGVQPSGNAIAIPVLGDGTMFEMEHVLSELRNGMYLKVGDTNHRSSLTTLKSSLSLIE